MKPLVLSVPFTTDFLPRLTACSYTSSSLSRSPFQASYSSLIHTSCFPAAFHLHPALLSPLPHPHLFRPMLTPSFSLHTHSLPIPSLLILTSGSPHHSAPIPVPASHPTLNLMVALSPLPASSHCLPHPHICLLWSNHTSSPDTIISPHLE